jgi:hypothetical protein
MVLLAVEEKKEDHKFGNFRAFPESAFCHESAKFERIVESEAKALDMHLAVF